jgi:hypothetical protein
MQPAPVGVVKAIAHVSPSAFAEAGAAITRSGPYTGSITVLESQLALTSDGKPLIPYLGANCCPYCAATRWPLAVAFARFGTFKRLTMTASGTEEPFPGTPA